MIFSPKKQGLSLRSQIRKTNTKIHPQQDIEIDISRRFPLGDCEAPDLCIKTEAKRILPNIRLGDKVECYIFAVSSHINIQNAKTMEDIVSLGGTYVWRCGSKVVIVKGDPEELAYAFQQMTERDKKIFTQKLRNQGEPILSH